MHPTWLRWNSLVSVQLESLSLSAPAQPSETQLQSFHTAPLSSRAGICSFGFRCDHLLFISGLTLSRHCSTVMAIAETSVIQEIGSTPSLQTTEPVLYLPGFLSGWNGIFLLFKWESCAIKQYIYLECPVKIILPKCGLTAWHYCGCQ